MAFLLLNGIPVPCALQAQSQGTPRLIGERVTAFSGRTRSTVRGHIRTWSLATPPIPIADARALELALASQYPLVAGGDLVDGIETPVIGQLDAIRHRKYADGQLAVVEFTLQDAEPYQPILFWLRADRALPAGAAFSRASAAWYFDRTGILREAGPNVPRVEWIDLDGDGVRETQTALLEPAATNLLLDSCNLPASGSAWGSTSNFTVSAAASIFQGQTAWRHQNLGLVSSVNRSQGVGTFSGQPETSSLIVENVDATTTDLSIFDSTLQAHVCLGRLTWATGQASIAAGAGTVLAQKLANAGPNGGPVYRLMVTGTGTAGNQRRIAVYPSGAPRNTQTAIVHHVQHEVGAVATSPIVTTTAAVTRAADSLRFPWPHAPQAMTVYLCGIELGVAALSTFTRGLWGISGAGARVGIWGASGQYRVEMTDSSGGFASSVAPITFAIGDRFELVFRWWSDGRLRLEAARNGGAPVQGNTATPPWGGLLPAWGAQVMYIGARAAGNEGPAAWMDAVVLRGAGWTMDQIRRLVA